MHTIEFILLILVAVLLSSILEQITTRISVPLIQIGLGVLLAILPIDLLDINLDPEFFFFAFIAPLLYYDAKNADKKALVEHATNAIGMAVGLVVAITLGVGFALHWLQPSIPLACAFALGAALGPTDAVAVSSLKKQVSMDRRENAILTGEALINDASGVVAFQFAVAAAVTGTFSLVNAAGNFFFLFFGGIVVGLILALVIHVFQRIVQHNGLDSATFHVMLDIIIPFLVYLVAESFHVSGILAVVAAGLLLSSFRDKRIGPNMAQQRIVSSSAWDLLEFGLNGFVFVLLGISLIASIRHSTLMETGYLVTLVLAITVTMIIVRFLWALFTSLVLKNPETGERMKFNKKTLISSLALTIAGPKGAVTLSIILSIPFLTNSGELFPFRTDLIFIASGVIMCTLLLANFALPAISPDPVRSKVSKELTAAAELRIDMLRRVIIGLSAKQEYGNATAVRTVIRSYNNRIQSIRREEDVDAEKGVAETLALDTLHFQTKFLEKHLHNHEDSREACITLLDRIDQRRHYLTHGKEDERLSLGVRLHILLTPVRRVWNLVTHRISHSLPIDTESTQNAEIRNLRIKLELNTVRYLQDMLQDESCPHPAESISSAIAMHTRILDSLRIHSPNVRIQDMEKIDEVKRLGLQLELDEIQDAYEEGTISRALARYLRENVYLMQLDLEDRI